MTAVEPISGGARSGTTTALLWMSVALASFSVVAIAGREAGRGMSTLDLMAIRSWISLAIIVAVLMATGHALAALRSRRLGLHAARGTVHFVAQFCWLKALTLIPLAQLFALEFTSPLWVALLAPVVLGERLTGWRLAAGAVGFTGILVTLGGGITQVDSGTLLALASAVGFAASMLTTKMLTRTDGTATILLYMFAFQTAVTLPLAVTGMTMPATMPLLWAVAVALAGLTAHFSLTKAFAAADAMVVAPMDFLRLPLIAVVAAIIYAEAVDPRVLAGGAIIVAGNVINIWAERWRVRPAPQMGKADG